MPVTTTVEERQSLLVIFMMALLLCSSCREVVWCELFTCCGRGQPLLMRYGSCETGNLRSGPHLSSLTLEATNALLPPLGSHRERLGL